MIFSRFRSLNRLSHRKISCRSFSRTSNMHSDEALLEVHNKTGVITLNRPKALNALNLPMIQTIHPVLKAWEQDKDIGAIIIKGAGEKAFCAGGDVKTIALKGKANDLSKSFFKEEYKLNLEIGQLTTPYVALIDGITMGGGVGLSVHGRYRVASEKSLFAMPETAIGLFPDVGGGHFLPRLPGKLGLYLALTGHRLKSRDVFFAGIATHFVSSKEVPYLEEELVQLNDPNDEKVKKVLNSYHEKCQEDAEFSLKEKLQAINSIFGGETIEAIFRNLEKDGSEWAMKQLETLNKMSPTSMKVTLRQLLEGGQISLADTLMMEYRISQTCMFNDDFFEGIRAVLIDRDNSPKWNPASIEDVTDEIVDSYFQKLPDDRELVI